MRTVNQAAAAALLEGVEPIVLARISWGNQVTELYADKDFSNYQGRILSFSGIRSQKTADGFSAVASCSLTLDDYNNSLKERTDYQAIEGSLVVISYYFVDKAGAETEIFRGRIAGPITWSEGQRTLTFEINSELENASVGYAIEESEFDSNTDDAVGKPWPLVFGKVAHSPALLVTKIPTTKLSKPCHFGDPSITQKLYKDTTGEAGGSVVFHAATSIQSLLTTAAEENTLNYEVSKVLYFEDALPLDTTAVEIDGVIFTGKCTGNQFEVTESNAVKWRDIYAGYRPKNDPDYENPKVIWLRPENAAIDLANHHCWWRQASGLYKPPYYTWENICVRQEGLKCWFKYPFKKSECSPAKDHPNDPTWCLIDSGFRLTEIRALAKNGLKIELEEFTDKLCKKLDQRRRTISKTGNKSPYSAFLRQLDLVKYLKNAFWGARAGITVRVWGGTTKDIYVANSVESTEVLCVYGLRTDENGQQIFTPIPSFCYNVELDKSTALTAPDPTTVTTIEFDRSLDSYKEQGWQRDQIWVTLESTAPSNTAEAIKWLFDNYSTMDTDSTSFANVANDVDKFPSHFTLQQTTDVLTLAKEMAWQSRCALILDGPTVKIKYLSLEPTPEAFTLSQSTTQFKTLEHQYTESHDIVTVAKGTYRRTYAPEPYSKTLHTAKKINVSRYGVRTKECNFTIYNNISYVRKSLLFWLNRWSRSWRMVECETFSDAMGLEVFDCITVSFTDGTLVNSSCLGIIESIEHNCHSNKIKLKVWLPIETGSQTQHDDAWMLNSYIEYDDPTTGLTGDDALFFSYHTEADVSEVRRELRKLESRTTVLGKVFGINNANPTLVNIDVYGDGPYATKTQTVYAYDTKGQQNLKIGDWIEYEGGQDGINYAYRCVLPVQLGVVETSHTNGRYDIRLIDTNDDDPSTFQKGLDSLEFELPAWATEYEPNDGDGDAVVTTITAFNLAELHVPHTSACITDGSNSSVTYENLLPIGTVVEIRHYAAFVDLDNESATGNDFWWFDRSPITAGMRFGTIMESWDEEQNDPWVIEIRPETIDGQLSTDIIKIDICLPNATTVQNMSHLQAGCTVAYLPYISDRKVRGVLINMPTRDDTITCDTDSWCGMGDAKLTKDGRIIQWRSNTDYIWRDTEGNPI